MNQEGNVLHVTTNLKISSSIDDKYLQDEHSLDEHFEVNGKILNESNFLCINCGPQVSILRKSNGSKYSFWSADRTTRDTVTKITCLVEVDLGSGVPLLAAGTEEGLLCFYYTGVSRILRAVQFNKKIVSLALLDNGDHSEIGNWISLPEELQLMNGVLAVGLDGGAIYLVDICRHLLEKSILEGGPVNIENPSQLLFINLRTDTASDIQAKKEYAMSHPGETLAIFLNESTIDQFRKMVTSNISSPVQRRSFDNSIEEFHLVVTALAYFKEIACLAVGFNSGCFQLWHLSLFRIIYVSPLMDAQVMPIAGFSLQEPTDDPHSVCFIWAAHQSASTGACRPFAAMYMVSFSSKKHIDGYGCFYENYKGCQSRYELSLGEDVDSVIDGRIICCHSISRVIQRRFPQWSMHSGNEDESIVSLCAIAWEVWTPDRTNVTSKLTLFDINQWYRAQMPGSLEVGGSNSYVTNLLLPNDNEEQPAPLLDVLISAESLKQFSAYQPLDEHYFPLSLSFACTCLYEHKKLECVWKGVQNELISSLESAGPSALLEPSRFFHRFLSVGLKPSFYEASDSANLSVMTERQMLLTVMLEQGHASFVKDCVRMWADGCLAVANCTLPTLLRWGWSAVTFYKQMADNICIQLFDLRSTPTMKEFVYVVSLLHKLSEIFDYILKNYRNFILEDNVELQSISLQLFIEYLDSVVWSTQHKLLPEVNEPSKTFDDVIQYPQIKLQNYILERREKMRQLSRKLLDVNGQLCLADLLLVDALLKTAPGGKRIISQWEAEGSLVGGLYPPPSLQSVLRIFLIRGVATDFKHMLIYYFLLDVTDLLQQDNPHGAKMLQNFVTKFRLSKSQVLITKAFWLIDHGKLKEAVDHLTHGNVNQNDITESNHKIVMYSLFVQGEPRLALAYSRAFNPQLGELEDAKFHLLLLLECGHILQAFDFQRKYRQWQTELLDLFFTVCMRRKELGIVYKLSLDSSEEEAFTQFLEANRHPHSEDLRVIYLLSRARYVEAIDVNKKLAVKRAQGPTPTPLFERRTPLKGLAFKKNSQKPKEDESRDQIRDVIVSAFAKTLPPITRELADFCSRQKNTLGTWKKVDRPDPLSVAVNQQPKQAGLKERFVELALAKTRQTWAPLLATPHALKSRLRSTVEETPFLRSTPFSFKSKANSPRSTEHNQSLMSASKFSAKRGLGLDDVDEASSILKSESRTKRARLDFDEILEKKRHNDNEGVTLLSTPFIKRKRAAVPSEVTPRTPLSILKSPWKSGQSSLSRQSDRGEAPSSPMPRQIRFCEELETESSVDKRSSSSAATPSRATIRFDAKSSEECHQEISETDEDIDMNSTPSHNQSDSENGDTEQSFIKVKLSVDEEKSRNRSQLESVIEKDANLTKTVDLEDENEQPQSEEDVSVIDVPSFDSQVENSSPDRVPSSPSRLSNYDHKERYADDEEEQVEEQKTYQDLSTASVFVNVSGELESSVYELEEGEIGAPEHDSIGVNEVADMAEEVVYSNEVGQEKEKEPGELDEEEDRVDIYAGIDDDDDVVKEDNLEPGDDEYYEDEFMENYRRGELEDKAEVKDSGSEVHEGRGSEDIKNEREEEDDDEEDEDEERKRQDEDDDDEVICLDDSSKSDGTSQEEEPVTVIPKRNRISSEDELDYEESRMYEDYGDEVAGGDNDFDEELEEEEAGEEEFAEEEEHLSDEEEHMEEEEEGEEEEEEEEDEEEYAQHLRSEDDDDDEDGVIDDCGGENREEVKNNIFNDPRSDKSSGHLDTNLNRSKGTSGGKLEGSKRFINPFCKKREVASTSIQDNSNVPESGKIASNEGEESQSVEVEQVDVSHDNQRLIESVVKVSDDSKCEVNDEEVDADNSELKIVSVTGNSSVFHQNQSAHESQHDESFGKLEISFEGDPESESIPIKQVEKSMTVDETALEMESRLDPESESIPIKQVEKSMTVDETALVMEEESAENRTEGSTVNESASEVVQSRLDTIEEVSVENQTEGSTMLASETTENKKADEKLETVVTSDDKLESNSNEPVSGRTEDVPNLDGTVVDRSFSTPLRTRRNRRSSSEVPPSRDLKLRRSARKSVSSNHLNELPLSAAEDKNMSKDFFDNSPTVPLDIRNTRSRRSSSVQRTPSKITRQSLGKSISTSLIADMTKMQAEDATVSSSQAMEETLKTPRLNSLKHPDSSTIEEKPELTMVSSCSEPVVESMVIEDTTNKTIDVQQTIEQEKTDLGFISDNKTTTEEVEVDETLQKKTEGKETDGNIVEESESIVEPSVDEKLSSTNRNKETVEEAMVALKKTTEGNETSTENIVEESMSVEPVVEETTVVEESGNIVEKKHSIVEQTADKEVEETVAATVTAVMDSSSSVKDIRRPGSRGTFSEAPESVYNENEDPVIPKPLPRRAASVSKLDDDTGKLSRIRRSSRRYRSGMVWSEYVKNVDSYNKFPLNSSCASSVSSALDVADDVSIASVRESISTATTATGATARKLRRSRFMDRSFLKTAIRSYDILLSDEEADDTTKSAVVSNVKPTRSSSVISVVGSVPTVAEEISPIKQVHSENAESQKEIESKLEHNDSMLTIHEEEEVEGLEEQDVDVVNETKNDGKIDTVISKRTRKGRTETKPKQKTPSETKDDDSDDSSSDMLLTELKSKVRKEKGRKKSVDVDSKVKDEKVEVSKPTKRSRSISSLSSKKTQSSLVDEGGEEEVSGRARLRRGRTSRSESPVGLRKLARKTSTVDGDLFGDDSPDTSLTSSLQRTFKRDLRRSKLLDRPPSRNVLDVIMSENEEEEENDVEEGDKKTKKEVKKRGKKEVIQDEDEGNSTPKGKRGRAKSVVLSDVESTPATPKRGRRAKQVAEDSDASMNAASSSKPKRSRRSSVMQETTPTKSRTPRIFSSPDSVASNASATATSKKRKRRSHLMPAASTPDSNAQSEFHIINKNSSVDNGLPFESTPVKDVSVIDSSIMDYTSSRRLTRHQLANMQKFPMRKEKLDESTIIEEHPSDSEDEGSVAESSVSSVMSTRSSARLRMKSMKK